MSSRSDCRLSFLSIIFLFWLMSGKFLSDSLMLLMFLFLSLWAVGS